MKLEGLSSPAMPGVNAWRVAVMGQPNPPHIRFRPIAHSRFLCHDTLNLHWSVILRGILSLIAVAMLVAACGRDGGLLGTTTLPNVRGKFLIEDDNRTTPLTSAQHSIYYVLGDHRKLIFQGSGAPVPVLALLTNNDILVRYCGGRIEKVETSFFENEEDVGQEGAELRILRLQPVTSSGLSANGEAICPPR